MDKIAQIIPWKKLPRKLNYFDYLIPAELQAKIKPGDWVEIPLNQIKLLGLVDKIKAQSDFPALKSLGLMTAPPPALFPHQVECLKWFSQYYYYSLGSTLKLFFPPRPKRSTTRPPKPEFSFLSKPQALKTTPALKKLADQIYASREKKFLVLETDAAIKQSFYQALCAQARRQKKQIAIIFPQKIRLRDFVASLPTDWAKDCLIWTPEDATSRKNQHYQDWLRIRSQEKRIILGTRSAIFTPLSPAALIVIDCAESEDHKQWDQNPRYSTVTVAQKIQELSGGRLVLCSPAPRMEDAYRAKQEKYKFISLSAAPRIPALVDLKEERKKGFTYMSEKLMEKITATQARHQDVLLIVNKKGLHGCLVCGDCGFEALCPNCQLPLTVSATENGNQSLVCYRCQHAAPVYLTCPQCKGVNLKKFGVGVEKIKKDLESQFKLAPILLDETLSANSTWPAGSVLLSTNGNLPQSIWEKIGLLGIVYVDSLIYLADFNATQRLYSFLRSLAASLPRSSEWLVQTAFPHNPAFQLLAKPYADFYQAELEVRKTFNYPPFQRLFKLFFQHFDKKVAEREARDLYRKLNASVEKTGGRLSQPYLYYAQQVRKRYRCQLALFLPHLSVKAEQELLDLVPDHWTIDKDPLNLV